jgi:hypothetical protein
MHLGHAMGDEVQHIQPRHALAFQKIDRVGVLFLEHGGQNIADGDLLFAGRMQMQHRPLQHPLQAQGLFRHHLAVHRQAGQLFGEIALQFALEFVGVRAATGQQGPPLVLEQHGVEDMLGGQVFMMAALSFAHRQGKGNLDFLGEHNRLLYASSRLQRSG